MEVDDPIAPFVLKTYDMVCDPSTDAVISWSHGNNSFVVLDPLNFSQRLLPTYFKHSNFSSFVRQLNTYGFRKVDPDRWEFANESFLRGQQQLLKKIIRRKSQQRNSTIIFPNQEEEMEKSMLSTLAQLKNDQRDLEEELEGINRRLQATEKKPQKMIAFLVKVAEDPDLLSKMVVDKEAARRLKKKKRRLMISSSPPSPSTTTTSSSSLSSASTASTTIETEMKNEEIQDIDVLLPNETSQRHLGNSLVGDEDLFAIVTAATASPSTDFVTTNTTTGTSAAVDALTSPSIAITVPPPFESNAQHNNNSNRMTFFSEWLRGMGSNIQ